MTSCAISARSAKTTMVGCVATQEGRASSVVTAALMNAGLALCWRGQSLCRTSLRSQSLCRTSLRSPSLFPLMLIRLLRGPTMMSLLLEEPIAHMRELAALVTLPNEHEEAVALP